ncbi:MAG: DoxX family protein [Thermoplasmatota archaeon]
MASATRFRTITAWTLSVLLAALFLMSGYGKLTNGQTAGGMSFDEQFVAWGLPAWARFPVGLAEVAGAIGLLVPRLRFYAAAGLTLVMGGAVLTHLRIAEYGVAIVPLVLGLLAAADAWITRPVWVQERFARSRAQAA